MLLKTIQMAGLVAGLLCAVSSTASGAKSLEAKAADMLSRDRSISEIDSYPPYQTLNAANRAYIGAGQFEEALAFWQQQSFSEPEYRISGLEEIARWAGRAGQLETARAIALEIPERSRAATLVELARLHQYRGQQDSALSLLAEAAQLPYDRNNWQNSFEASSQIAQIYAELDQLETAKQVLVTAEQNNPAPERDRYPVADWVNAFAKIGAFGRAFEILKKVPVDERYTGLYRLAVVYANRRDYDRAIALTAQIPDRGVFLPHGDPDSIAPVPKLALLDRMIEETLEQGKFETAQRIAEGMEQPAEQVNAWVTIAIHFQKEQPQMAIEALDRALILAADIERRGFRFDPYGHYEASNAELLRSIAAVYWTVGEQTRAVEVLEGAIASARDFQTDRPLSKGLDSKSLMAIARLAREWQQFDLQTAALKALELQLEEAAESTGASSEESENWDTIENLGFLIKLAYAPVQTPSVVFSRNSTRLQKKLDETSDLMQRLSTLHVLADVYSQTDRRQQTRTTIEQIIEIIKPLPAEERDRHYRQLANITTQTDDLESQLQILPRISSRGTRIEVLREAIEQFSQENDVAQTIVSFERMIPLAQRFMGEESRDFLLSRLSNHFTYFLTTDIYYLPSLNSAEIMLMKRIPQYVSAPQRRAEILMQFAPNLPPDGATQAYKLLSSTFTQMPNGYDKRTFLWKFLDEAISHQDFEQATQVAYGLDGDYRQTALGQIETARQNRS